MVCVRSARLLDIAQRIRQACAVRERVVQIDLGASIEVPLEIDQTVNRDTTRSAHCVAIRGRNDIVSARRASRTMRRVPRCAGSATGWHSVSLGAALVLVAACGSTTSPKSATPSTTSSTPAVTSTTSGHSTHDPDHGQAVVPKPIPVTSAGYLDATRVDLGGTPGTTPTQQRAAEDFLRRLIRTLPRWADYEQALRDGFVTLDGGITGFDHMMHWDWLNDGRTFDPAYPESLVYTVDPKTGERRLEAAMFFLPDGVTLDNAPNTFGSLVQYHVHPDLCFERGATTRLTGVAPPPQPCPAGTERLPNPMMHAWIVPNECGPFAALEGIGGGQTKSGQHDCDRAHGSTS